MDAARVLSEEPDLRRGLCLAARLVVGADTGTLWEPRSDGLLENTGTTAAMAPIGGMLLPLARRTVAGLAIREDRRVFVPDTEGSADVVEEIVRPVGLRSVMAQPVRRMGAPVAALVVGWRTPVGYVPGEAIARLELLAAVGGTALQALQSASRLEHLALTDALTGLPNRRHLDGHLAREVARAGRRGTTLGIAALDLDDLKGVNDRHGHAAGDQHIVSTTSAWRTHLRAGDLLARVGGDEFVLVLPDCGDLEACCATVERVRSEAGGGASAGVATWRPGEAPEELLRRADDALYTAKRDGRRRTVAAG